MNRTAALFAVLALVVAGVAVPAAGSAPVSTGPAEQMDASNDSSEPAAPGARLAGVVAVQGAEVRSEIDGRAFGIRIDMADSNGSKAAVVADQVADVERRLDDLEARRQALEAARENGTVSRARYDAEVATLSARSFALNQQLARTAAVSATLPADVLSAHGVNASAIDALRTEARGLTGPEAAEIARSIAGPGAGLGLSVAGNASGGPPADRPSPGGDGRSGLPDDAGSGDGTVDANGTDADGNVTVTVDVPPGGDP